MFHDPENPSADLWPERDTQITIDQAKAGTDGMEICDIQHMRMFVIHFASFLFM